MTSAIVSSPIDAAFPVAGQDNNSQGFRDNFSYIKTGLATAASEITSLQTNTAKTNVDNDFNGVKIENAEVNMLYGSVLSSGNISSATNIDVRDGEYFSYTFTSNITLTFAHWPVSDRFARVRVDIKCDGSARTVNFATTSGSVIADSGLNLPFTTGTNTAKHYIFDAWTINGGNTVFVKYVGVFG
jgi:hypothetical protein